MAFIRFRAPLKVTGWGNQGAMCNVQLNECYQRKVTKNITLLRQSGKKNSHIRDFTPTECLEYLRKKISFIKKNLQLLL